MIYICMPEGSNHWLWRIDQQEWHSCATLDELVQNVKAQLSDTAVATVFFPSQTAQFYTHALSRAQYKQLGQSGVQYLVEEYSIDPIDQLAVFYVFESEHVHFMVLPQHVRDTYQNTLALLPWQVQALLPDFLITPEPAPDEINMMYLFDRLLVRWSKWRGWAVEQLDMINYLPVDFKDINGYCLTSQHVTALKSLLSPEVTLSLNTQAEQILSIKRPHAFNALTKTKRQKTSGLNYWAACAVIAIVAVVFQISYDTLRWLKYKKIADQTAALAITQYQNWFPDASRITEQNLRAQFRAKLAENAVADRQVLELISRVGPLLQQAGIPAQQISYQNNILNMHLIAKNSDALTQLIQQLKQQGFNAELGEIRNQGNNVIGMIKVQ